MGILLVIVFGLLICLVPVAIVILIIQAISKEIKMINEISQKKLKLRNEARNTIVRTIK